LTGKYYQCRYYGSKPIGKARDREVAIHRIAGGRLTEHWEEIDLLGLFRQLGALG
jgi:hypothetical protein